jgi:MFS family permease
LSAVLDEFGTPRPVAGWRVVLTAFCMAVFAWGLGFYALSVYAQYLAQQGHFTPALLAAATTWHFLVGAGALYAVDAAVARIGRRPAVFVGVALLAGGAAVLPQLRSPVALFAVYALMAFGWAATSGTAITQIVGAWFVARRGLALNLALTGASFAGFLVVPAMVAAIARFGLDSGIALVAGLLALGLSVLLALNLHEPQVVLDAAGAAAGKAVAPAGPLRMDARLTAMAALFGIGWLAQVAFLSQQLPLLVPKVGAAAATAAVAAATAASLLGRLLLAGIVDRLDHRRVTAASFALQALGMGLILLGDGPLPVIAGSALFGASVGNLITMPALFAQREFAPEHYAAVVTRVWSVGQVLYAFGPLAAGLLQARTGSPAPTLAACMVGQLLAAAIALWRPGAMKG